MTTIEMDTDMARMQYDNLSAVIEKLIETRKILIDQCESLKPIWQSPSADEFQGLQIPQMNIFWSKIQTLIQLKIQLNAAITVAEETAQRLAGG